MTTAEIINLDIEVIQKLNTKQLQRLTTQIVSTANKRVKALKSAGLEDSLILTQMKDFSGRFTSKIKGKKNKLNRLRNIFLNVRNFLLAETSTVRGYKKYNRETAERIAGNKNMRDPEARDFVKRYENDIELRRDFWRIYNRLRETYPDKFSGKGASERIQNLIRSQMQKMPFSTTDEIYESMEDILNNDSEPEFEYDPDLSDFFDLDD